MAHGFLDMGPMLQEGTHSYSRGRALPSNPFGPWSSTMKPKQKTAKDTGSVSTDISKIPRVPGGDLVKVLHSHV